MTEYHPLLPPNQTPLEAALGFASDLRPDTTAAPISTLERPDAAPSAVLPWLAWGNDVLVWPEGPEEIQRAAIAGSLALHRKAGTLAAFKEVARLLGGEVVQAIRPPAKMNYGKSRTAEERNALLRQYPELRVYRYRSRGEGVSGSAFAGLMFAGGSFWHRSTAAERYGERAFLVDRGVETPIKSAPDYTGGAFSGWSELRIPGAAGAGAFAGRMFGQYFLPSSAASRLLRVRTDTLPVGGDHLAAVIPSLDPLSLTPEVVAERGVSGPGLFANSDSWKGAFWLSSNAGDRLYRRWYLYDQARRAGGSVAQWHWGVDHLGMPSYHAELRVSIPGKRPDWALPVAGIGYWSPVSRDRLGRVLEGFRAVASCRDRIKVQPSLYAPLSAGTTVIAGAVKAGQLVRRI